MTHNMTCAITDGFRPNDVDTVEGEAAKALETIEDSFRADVELAKQYMTKLFAAYENDMSEHGGDFHLSDILDGFDNTALDAFYTAKRQAEAANE